MRRAGAATVLAIAAGLTAAGAAIPAGVAHAGGNGGGVTPPTTSTPTYSVTAQGNIQVSGDHTGGFSGYYQPPDCWLQPWFQQPESYRDGDPAASGSAQGATDADSFWWYMAGQYPGLKQGIAHIPDAAQEINNDFKMVQQGQNDVPGGPDPVTADFVWWAPNWLNNSAGWACVQNLMAAANMNNGFLDLEPPQKAANGPGEITGQDLAALARATLRLPGVVIHTSLTGADATAFVNSPIKLWLTFNPVRQPADDAKVVYAGGTYLEAKITTSVPRLTITTSDPGAGVVSNQVCLAADNCSVTFVDPSASGSPFTITVVATWTVTWQTSDGGAGTFTQPPARVTATRTVVAREIQSLN